MLLLVNQARADAGLSPVAADDLAAQVAQAHAEEMAAYQYMSHWNRQGFGPDVRYSLAGGTEVVQENVYSRWYQSGTGQPVPIQDWPAEVETAHRGWMSSPGHRANILNPEHTHLGTGIAFNPAQGRLAMAQEFVNRYVALDPLPRTATIGQALALSGHLLPGATDPLVNLAYEPNPLPLTVEQLNATGSYGSPAQPILALQPNLLSEGRFSAQITLDSPGHPGLYHLRLWVTTANGQVPAAEVVVRVEEPGATVSPAATPVASAAATPPPRLIRRRPRPLPQPPRARTNLRRLCMTLAAFLRRRPPRPWCPPLPRTSHRIRFPTNPATQPKRRRWPTANRWLSHPPARGRFRAPRTKGVTTAVPRAAGEHSMAGSDQSHGALSSRSASSSGRRRLRGHCRPVGWGAGEVKVSGRRVRRLLRDTLTGSERAIARPSEEVEG